METAYVTIITDILLLDIVGFSKLENFKQYHTIKVLQEVVSQQISLYTAFLRSKGIDVVLGIVPTGDGFYAILHPAIAGYGPLLALGLRNYLLMSKKSIHGLYDDIRVGVHLGSAIPFKDMTGRLNFIGDGLNDTARILNLDDELKKKAEEFAECPSFVAVSKEALEQFNSTWRNELPRNFWETINFRQSDAFVQIDKHKKEHTLHFIESKRNMMFSAPKSISIEQEQIDRLKKHLEEVMKDSATGKKQLL